MQPLWEVVYLEGVLRHVVHKFRHQGWGIFPPHLIFDSRLKVYESNLIVPVAFKRVRYLFSLHKLFEHLSFKFETFFTEPAASSKLHFALQLGIFQVCYRHSFTNVDINLSNNQIVNTEYRWFQFILLIELVQLNKSFKLLLDLQSSTWKTCVCFVVCVILVVFTLAMHSCDWWMVRNLLSNKIEFLCLQLVCLSK